MARGKLKYRDVVGGKSQKSKKTPKKNHQRKTYSLYKPDNRRNSGKKRKHEFNEVEDEKRQKHAEEIPVAEESSESEEEVEDHMKYLRESLSAKLVNKQLAAIDSSEDSESENDNKSEEDDKIKQEEGNETDQSVDIRSDDDVVENDTEIATLPENSNENDLEISEEDLNEDGNDNETDNINDPFVKHICSDLHENVLTSLQNALVNNSVEQRPRLGKLIIQIPQCEVKEEKPQSFTIEEQKQFALPGSVPTKITSEQLTKPETLFIKTQIVGNLFQANKSLRDETLFTDFQAELFSIINNYQDLYFCERNFINAEEIRFVYCLHAVNHILKTRLKVVHHNVRLTKKDDVPEEFRDQGLVRPKILMIVPFKDSAYRIIQMIISILLPEDKGHVMNKKRFLEDYTGNEISMPKKNPKPEDYELTFAGNTSDDFKIGITVTKKSLKLYADFYSSDIIIASPLGLRTLVGAEGEVSRNYDFLASIELLILDQTELFLMQNWDHLIHVLNHLHLQPKESHGTDFSRVRTWSLNGHAKYYRQTLIFSSIASPEINSIYNKKCTNYAGKVKVANAVEFGSIRQVFVQIPHVFHKFEAPNAQESIDARFEFFVGKIFPQQKDSLMKQTLICVSSYFDYVRLRNYFKREDVSFAQICEYSKGGKIARARDMFYHGDVHFLLYTERYHFFNRIRIKGIRHLVFYQPPKFPHFYYELCNLMQETNMNKKIGNTSNMTVNVIYSKYDVQQLAALVGTDRATKMLQSDRSVHMMVTGE